MRADSTPEERDRILILRGYEHVIAKVMTEGLPELPDPRAEEPLVRLLKAGGFTRERLASEGVSVSLAAVRLYEWLMSGQIPCVRCIHDWLDHEPPELADVPDDALEDAVQAHPELDYSCRVHECGCRGFLNNIPDDVKLRFEELGLL